MSELAPEVQPVIAMPHHISWRRAAALAVSALAIATPIAESRPAQQKLKKIGTSYNLPRTESGPWLQVGIEDQGAVNDGDVKQLNLDMSKGIEMGASNWRFMIHPQILRQDGWQDYMTAAETANQRGLDLSISINCTKTDWSERSFAAYILDIASQLKGKVKDYTICNEPNINTIRTMESLDEACTYRTLYKVGYEVIKGRDPQAKVLFGAVTAYGDPLGFLDKVLACRTSSEDKGTLLADGLAYHPYQFIGPPTDPNPPDGAVGIGSLPKIENWLKTAYDQGLLMTARGSLPKLYLKEFGYQTASRGEDKRSKLPSYQPKRYLTETEREVYEQQVYEQVCKDPNIANLTHIGFTESKPEWPGFWNTSLIKRDGTPFGSYYTIKNFIAEHPKCVKPTKIWRSK